LSDRTGEAIERLNSALERVKRDMDAMECHGTLVGLLCAKGAMDEQQWLNFIATGRDPGDLLAREGLDILAALHGETVRQLSNTVLDFHPLLPPDDAPLDERVLGLGEWCQGFLMGLTEGGITDLAKLPADSAEVVNDMAEIARAGGYEFGEGEEDESAYSEILEYVRTGVLLINEELNPTKAPPLGDVTLH
jgi:yecA family protein